MNELEQNLVKAALRLTLANAGERAYQKTLNGVQGTTFDHIRRAKKEFEIAAWQLLKETDIDSLLEKRVDEVSWVVHEAWTGELSEKLQADTIKICRSTKLWGKAFEELQEKFPELPNCGIAGAINWGYRKIYSS